MTADLCYAEVSEPPYYLHRHRCNRPAKGHRQLKRPSLPTLDVPVCGIHLRAKYTPVMSDD